jgi:hypothetical protein
MLIQYQSAKFHLISDAFHIILPAHLKYRLSRIALLFQAMSANWLFVYMEPPVKLLFSNSIRVFLKDGLFKRQITIDF